MVNIIYYIVRWLGVSPFTFFDCDDLSATAIHHLVPPIARESGLQFYMSPLGWFGGHRICSLCSRKRGIAWCVLQYSGSLTCMDIFADSSCVIESSPRCAWLLNPLQISISAHLFFSCCMVLFRSHQEFLCPCTSLWDSYAVISLFHSAVKKNI